MKKHDMKKKKMKSIAEIKVNGVNLTILRKKGREV
jgi:hypothetical protein